ncbi:hypothetical protein BDW75DRAFT_241181 [Aspergillus navahoensis]
MAKQFESDDQRGGSLDARVQNEKPGTNGNGTGTGVESPPLFLLDKESLERLGRKRPEIFPNRWIELGFCFCLLSSELLATSMCPCFLATVGGFTLHHLPGKLLLLISGAGYLVSMLLFAIIPDNPNYWAYVFPAMVAATVGVDIGYSVSNIFITTNLPQNRQGVAGAIINTIVFVGISFFLGLADLVVAQTQDLGLAGSYKAAFWFGVACSGAAIGLLVFIRVGKAQSDLTVEERIQLAESLAAAGHSS